MDVEALIRPKVIAAALANRLDDRRWLQMTVRLISGGKSNLTFELNCAAGQLILRRPPTGSLLRGAHDMAREVRIQQALAQTRVPVPGIVWAELEPGLLDVGFYVMQRLPGVVLRVAIPRALACSPANLTAITDSLVDTLGLLHAVDPGHVGMQDFGRPSGFAARQVRTWQHQYRSAQSRDIAAMTELHRRLANHRWPEVGRASIVHGDYRLDNCLVDSVGARISGVLDWELSTVGDPLCDLGMLLFYWVQPGEPVPRLTPALTATAGFVARSAIAQRYALATGADLEDLSAYVALAHFKFAGIAQGIAARVAAGQMAGQDFGELDNEIERIAEAGVDAMKGNF